MPGLSKKEKRQSKRPAPPPKPPRAASTWRFPHWTLPKWTPPEWLTRILRHPATSYVGILLLQLKVLWGMWWYREIDVGDTDMYFVNAAEIIQDGRIALAQ